MALSANRSLSIRNDTGKRVASCTVATGQTIYKHGLCVLKDAGTSCKVAENETTTTFLGLSDTGYAAAATGKFYTGLEVSIPKRTAVTAGAYGALLYCYDDEYVTTLATLGPVCGVHRGIDSSNTANVWVLLGAQTADTKAS